MKVLRKTEQCIQRVKEARGDPVFQGIEHVGLYPTDGVTVDKIAAWYAETFGLNKVEGESSVFLNALKTREGLRFQENHQTK